MPESKTYTCRCCGQEKSLDEVRDEHLRVEVYITSTCRNIRARSSVILCRSCQAALAQDLRPYYEDPLTPFLSHLRH